MDSAATETSDVTSSNSQGGQQHHNTSQAHTVQTEPGTTGGKTTVSGQDTQESSECNGSEDKKEELTLDPSGQAGAYPFFTFPWRILALSFSSTNTSPIRRSLVVRSWSHYLLPTPDNLPFPTATLQLDRLDIRTRPWTRSRTCCFRSTCNHYQSNIIGLVTMGISEEEATKSASIAKSMAIFLVFAELQATHVVASIPSPSYLHPSILKTQIPCQRLSNPPCCLTAGQGVQHAQEQGEC